MSYSAYMPTLSQEQQINALLKNAKRNNQHIDSFTFHPSSPNNHNVIAHFYGCENGQPTHSFTSVAIIANYRDQN